MISSPLAYQCRCSSAAHAAAFCPSGTITTGTALFAAQYLVTDPMKNLHGSQANLQVSFDTAPGLRSSCQTLCGSRTASATHELAEPGLLGGRLLSLSSCTQVNPVLH